MFLGKIKIKTEVLALLLYHRAMDSSWLWAGGSEQAQFVL